MFIHLPVLFLLAAEGQPLPGPMSQETLGPTYSQISMGTSRVFCLCASQMLHIL